MACVYALQEASAQACVWLRRAIGMTNRYAQMARTDSDFDGIRATAEFEALMAQFDKKAD
jgi:hypothetical protein